MTKLIVKNYHKRGNHAAGVNFILCKLSERFWIIAAREEIREWDHECNECRRSPVAGRRGVPKEVISDRGTNFVGAVSVKLARQLDRRHLQSKTAELELT